MNDEIELSAPSTLPFEVANSIWKNTNIRAQRARNLAKVLVQLSPRLVGLSEAVAGEAISVARKGRLNFYDASYLALARTHSQSLITADDGQIDAASGYVLASHISSFPA